ncbi:MAG: prepilin peptidase, partial [Rhodospirillales bacterium]|nr:prepilin peptidase [Rhodospirillales bacterium]
MDRYWQLVASVPIWVWSGIAFIYGAIVGSFLNVCIHRIPRKEEIVRTPSHCPHCNERIPWFHNIPIFSWLVLKGKAACCGATITARYALVELLTAVLSAYILFQFGFTIHAFGYWIFTCFLIVLIFIDWEHMRLPNVLTLPGAVIGLLFALLGENIGILDSVIGVLVGAG